MLKNGQNFCSIRLKKKRTLKCGSELIWSQSRSAYLRCTKLVELFETTVFAVEPYLRWKFRYFQEQVPRLTKRSLTEGNR